MPSRRPLAALSTLLLSSLAFSACPSPARAAWGVEPVQVRATSASCPLVASASDSRGGAIVVWQEGTAPGGVLQAERLDANGEVGSWAHAPVTFCEIDTPRHGLGALSDGMGGAYVWWMEYTMLYLTRLTPDGFIAEGWAARGYPLGSLVTEEYRPLAKSDGQGGVYIGWIQANTYGVRMMRFEADGLPAGGWPAAGQTIPMSPVAGYSNKSFGFEPASDGGLWVGAQCFSSNGPWFPDSPPGVLMVQRLDPSGAPATGWESGALGVVLLASSPGNLFTARTGTLALASDGQGGVFMASIESSPVQGGTQLRPQLRRLGPDGTPPTGWTYDGVELTPRLQPAGISSYADASVLAVSGHGGEVFVGTPDYPPGDSPRFSITRFSAAGAELPGSLLVRSQFIDSAPRDDGGLFVGACKAWGPSPGFPGPALVGVWQTPTGANFIESQGNSPDAYYDDLGLASTGDGGAILAWAQHLGRQGVFAVRVGPEGLVTSVPPTPAPHGLRVWFARGTGVQVTGATGRVTLSLHDLTGRQVAHGESPGAGDWTVPGTAGLPSGMYFAKAITEGPEKRAKVIVIR